MQNSPNTNPMGELTASPSSRTTCKTARTSTRQAGAPLRERDFACKTARAPALTTALRMTELRPGAPTSPARSRANAGQHRGRQQATGAGNRAMETAALEQATGYRGRQQSNGNGALEQATGHRSRQFAYPNRRFPAPMRLARPGVRWARRPRPVVSCPDAAHRAHDRTAAGPLGPLVHRRQPAPAQRNPSAPRCPHSSTARSASTWTCAPWVVLTAMLPLSQRYHTSQAL